MWKEIEEILAEEYGTLKHDAVATRIMDLPRVKEAFEALAREESYSSIYDADA